VGVTDGPASAGGIRRRPPEPLVVGRRAGDRAFAATPRCWIDVGDAARGRDEGTPEGADSSKR